MERQADFFLHEGLSFRLADSPYLLPWLQAFAEAYELGSADVAHRKQLPAVAHSRVEDVRDQVIDRLRLCKGVTVALDGWTNVRHDKVINLCPVGRGVAYYWDSIVLKRRATADEQHAPVAAGLRSIMNASVRLVAIVTDNEAVNKALYSRLLLSFPFLLRVPCAAHAIQLAVHKALKLPAVRGCAHALVAMLLAFKHNKPLRIDIRDEQAVHRRGKPVLQILSIVVTRWNSLLFAAERVLELEDCIRPCVPKIIAQLSREKKRQLYTSFTYDALFWHSLRSLVTFLIPYRDATNVVQRDAACIADVHQQFALLMDRADKLAVPHPLASMREEVMDTLRHEWDANTHRSAIIICALYNFDASATSFPADQMTSAIDWLTLEWGPVFLLQYGLSDYDDAEHVSGALLHQRSDFVQREGHFATLDRRRAGLSSVQTEPDNGLHRHRARSRATWGLYINTTPELAACALAVLDLTASEAAAERSFSRQGLIHTKARNRLSDNSVQMRMAFSFNKRAMQSSSPRLQQSDGPASGCEELPDGDGEDLEAAASRGTALLSQYRTDEELAAEEERDEADIVGLLELEEEEDESEQPEEPAGEGKEEKAAESEDEEEKADSEGGARSGKAAGLRKVKQAAVLVEETPEEQRRHFIKKYVEDRSITHGYRWNGVKEQALQAALLAAGVKDTVEDVKKMIKAHVAPPADATESA